MDKEESEKSGEAFISDAEVHQAKGYDFYCSILKNKGVPMTGHILPKLDTNNFHFFSYRSYGLSGCVIQWYKSDPSCNSIVTRD